MFSESKKVVIGYYVDDGYVTSVPAMKRGVMEAIEKLKKNGHTVRKQSIFKLTNLELKIFIILCIFTGRVNSTC